LGVLLLKNSVGFLHIPLFALPAKLILSMSFLLQFPPPLRIVFVMTLFFSFAFSFAPPIWRSMSSCLSVPLCRFVCAPFFFFSLKKLSPCQKYNTSDWAAFCLVFFPKCWACIPKFLAPLHFFFPLGSVVKLVFTPFFLFVCSVLVFC